MSKEEIRVEMLSMVADWQQSGKSDRQYYQEKGISEHRFLLVVSTE